VRFVSGVPAPTAGEAKTRRRGLYRARSGAVMLRFDVCTSSRPTGHTCNAPYRVKMFSSGTG
jgi:hypothetical protein